MKPFRPSLIALGALALALACDRSPTGVPGSVPSPSFSGRPPQPPARKGEEPNGRPNSQHRIRLMRCSELPPARARQVIGPAGGTISVGPHELRVPSGALAKAVLITAELRDEDHGYNAVRFHPHGLTFQAPAYLTMSYANCHTGDGSRLAYVQIVYTHGKKILESEPSVADLEMQTVTGEITHFSNYAVAW
jgi:hypothetical protein